MANGTVILLGNLPPGPLDRVVTEFGWSLEIVRSLDRVREMSAGRKLIAILFEPYSLGLSWSLALRSVLYAAPTALPIACHRFSDAIDWPELANAGAFHALSSPFNERELRQSLGFIWARRFERLQKPLLELHRAQDTELVA